MRRLQALVSHIDQQVSGMVPEATAAAAAPAAEEIDEDEVGGDGSITVIDNRTGKKI